MEHSERLSPMVVGITLAATVAIAYTLCAAAWAIWNEAALDFINALFHGLDFRKIYAATPFSAGMFAYVLVMFAAWAYILGAIYALVRNALIGNGTK